MNWQRLEGNWTLVKGIVKEQWGKLTHDQLEVVSGRRNQLVGSIQESYGVSKEDAEWQVDQWEARNANLFEEEVVPGAQR